MVWRVGLLRGARGRYLCDAETSLSNKHASYRTASAPARSLVEFRSQHQPARGLVVEVLVDATLRRSRPGSPAFGMKISGGDAQDPMFGND